MNKICVFAGSNAGVSPEYGQAATELGQLMAAKGIELVYGGSRIGLMGLVADAVLANGGRVTGVMPRGLFIGEMAHKGLTEFIEVGNMHERKALMSELSDGYIALPGGLGTFEELFEVASWAQLGIHKKPVGILNVKGFYQPIADMLNHAVSAGFMRDTNLGLMLFEANAAVLLDQMAAYTAPEQANKWAELPK
ncbi:TIGR00730 family Rossman fold protein [Paenibacillus glycanilyticus]|uniref:Cytokinin riboside 5'-monophosphate phosphoribohydrolase n=1 Tax=Paenibacillus glycanilyticus TaxID=126569 RepID=A0ABQ6GFX0_9BACL|nr:TIGR00730 family Rossman fold protein [Paenibacillus glycanilyticus]GLX69856.1 cytokinin riboside 5'-monophosphate phosphoribohydrolase [Paenibacillus glycanilyticus]